MKVIGLTGGIATGKSTVAGLLRDKGVPIVDADQVARDVVAPGTDGLAAVVARFGPDVLSDGGLDRARLRGIIIRDPVARKDLEAITHPRIYASIAERVSALRETGANAVVVEAALMVETGSYLMYDALIVVSCAPETQLDRLVQRGGHPEGEARGLIAMQLPLADKENVATAVIRNEGDLDALKAEVDRVWAIVVPPSERS